MYQQQQPINYTRQNNSINIVDLNHNSNNNYIQPNRPTLNVHHQYHNHQNNHRNLPNNNNNGRNDGQNITRFPLHTQQNDLVMIEMMTTMKAKNSIKGKNQPKDSPSNHQLYKHNNNLNNNDGNVNNNNNDYGGDDDDDNDGKQNNKIIAVNGKINKKLTQDQNNNVDGIQLRTHKSGLLNPPPAVLQRDSGKADTLIVRKSFQNPVETLPNVYGTIPFSKTFITLILPSSFL